MDSHLLRAVDAYVARTDGCNRSRVLDEALWLWYAREQSRAMEAQYAPSPSEEESTEREEWRRIRTAAAAVTLARRE